MMHHLGEPLPTNRCGLYGTDVRPQLQHTGGVMVGFHKVNVYLILHIGHIHRRGDCGMNQTVKPVERGDSYPLGASIFFYRNIFQTSRRVMYYGNFFWSGQELFLQDLLNFCFF